MSTSVNCLPPSAVKASPFILAVLLSFAAPGRAFQAPAAESAAALSQARALLTRHQDQAANRLLSSYLSSHPADVDALTLLAQIHLRQSDPAAAKELLLKALTVSPNAPLPNKVLGQLLLEEDHAPEAMDRFETVLAIDPRDHEARQGELKAVTQLAITARRANRPDAALQALEHARSRLPDDPELLLELGIQATELGQMPEAADALNQARKLDPKNLDVLYALARLETELQHMPAAEADLRAYLAERPNDASAHYGLGHIFAMQQRTAEARAEFERSIQLQPVQTESYYQLGQLELDVQHDAQAEPLFQKVLARDPTHGGALTGMGILAFRQKNYAIAEQYLFRAEETAPDYQPAHYYRGLALARLGQKEESQRELQLATELDRKQQGPPGALTGDPGNAAPATPSPPQ